MQDKKNKDLNLPINEEISEEAYPLVQTFLSHLKELSIIVGIIILVATGYSGYKIYKQKALTKAKQSFKSILMLKDKKQEIVKLKSLLLKAPPELKDAIRFQLVILYLKDKNYKGVQRVWEEINKTTKDLDIKFISTLGRAESFILQKKYKNALQLLDSLKSKKEYREIIFTEIANTAEMAKDYKQALWAYNELKSIISDRDPNLIYYKYKIAELKKKL